MASLLFFYGVPKGIRTPVAGVKVLPHHPTTTDFIEYINTRKSLNGISDTTFCVRLCVQIKFWQIELSTY